MQKECIIRICSTCDRPLPWSDTESGQCGWLCCDEYFCSKECLDKSFEGQEVTWGNHYSYDGDCYHTDWGLEELE